MTSLPRNVALAAAILCAGTAAQAAESGFSFSGFGTLGTVHSSTDEANYTNPYQVHEGSRDNWDETLDSRLGVQGSYTLNPTFSATAQVQTHETDTGNWNPQVEWLFGKANIGTTGLSVRVGRMGGPFFMVSDFRDVGYANTWVRPPLDVYGQVFFSHFDGADALYEHSFGDANFTAQVLGGSVKQSFDTFTLHVYGAHGLNTSLEYGPFTFRAGYIEGTLTGDRPDLDQLVAGLDQVGALLQDPAISDLGTQLSIDHKKASFTGLGVSLDWHDVVGSAEWTQRKIDAFTGDTSAWYVTGGYRIGKFTPYATYSQIKMDRQLNNSALPPVSAVPAELQPTIGALTQATDALFMSVAQKTASAGLRWDVYKNIDVKAQYDRISVPDNSVGMFMEPDPSFAVGGHKVNVYSLAVDFVF